MGFTIFNFVSLLKTFDVFMDWYRVALSDGRLDYKDVMRLIEGILDSLGYSFGIDVGTGMIFIDDPEKKGVECDETSEECEQEKE